MEYKLIDIESIYNPKSTKRYYDLINDFSCINKDVEKFLKEKAIDLSLKKRTKTFLVVTEITDENNNQKNVIVAYFSLSSKTTKIKKDFFGNKTRSRIEIFADNDDNSNMYSIHLPLIGQLGKNFSNGYNKLISGEKLLELAIEKVRIAQSAIGGRFVYLECEDVDKLIDFYTNNGFVCYGSRELRKNERYESDNKQITSLQLLIRDLGH